MESYRYIREQLREYDLRLYPDYLVSAIDSIITELEDLNRRISNLEDKP